MGLEPRNEGVLVFRNCQCGRDQRLKLDRLQIRHDLCQSKLGSARWYGQFPKARVLLARSPGLLGRLNNIKTDWCLRYYPEVEVGLLGTEKRDAPIPSLGSIPTAV